MSRDWSEALGRLALWPLLVGAIIFGARCQYTWCRNTGFSTTDCIYHVACEGE